MFNAEPANVLVKKAINLLSILNTNPFGSIPQTWGYNYY